MNEIRKRDESERQLSCPIVRDLLPNYIEHLTESETNEMIERHLCHCKECTSLKENLMKDLMVDKAPLYKNTKKVIVRTKMLLVLKSVLIALSILAILVCSIVDLAVNHKLSWSVIVDGGIVYGMSIAIVALKSKKYRLVKTLLCISLLLMPFLYLIQIVLNAFFLSQPTHWFAEQAVPICLLWIGLVWVIVLLETMFRLNFWNLMGSILLAGFIGSPLTVMFATQLPLLEAVTRDYKWIDSILYVVGAISCFVVGRIRKCKRIN